MCIFIHMSTLYLSSDPRSLADKLADELDRQAKDGDFFAPATIVVPNRYLKKWLRLFLARRLGVAINLDFQYLEDALWQLLPEAQGRPALGVQPRPALGVPDAIDENIYRLMVLSVLLEEDDPDLTPLQRYLQRQDAALTPSPSPKGRGENGLSRLACRRAWYLADRLGLRLQDYEYHRQDALIQRWLVQQFGLAGVGAFHQMMERAQRAVFLHITREPDGKRALLNRLGEKTFKTFPQYAMECMTQDGVRPSPPTPLPGGEGSKGVAPLPGGEGRKGRAVHFFGFTQISELHARTVAWLGQFFDVRFYHLNVLASRYNGDLQATAQELREGTAAEDQDRGRELLRLWGRAGAESLALVAPLQGSFATELLPAYEAAKPAGKKKSSRSATVLARLRDQLLGTSTAKERLSQDASLQIVGCPGVAREVETVYNSIVHNLQNDPSLRQTDIAVLVTDMPRYRAALQAVFERPPKRLQYNLVDFSAAGISVFGQALLGMLDLALESFSRTRVFQVILNPCFLARLGVDRAQAMTWLEWAEGLGIYQGWDAEEKQQQGYPPSPFYAWRLGLQRLRLGRFMEVAGETADQPASRFGHVIPFADLASTDREHLDAFCRAVEGLLPTLTRLRSAHQSGTRWAGALERLVHEFLDVPADRPEEAQVRAELLAAVEKLAWWDSLHDASPKRAGLPLALVREYVQSQLEVLEGNRGEYLIGGVTVSALQPMRPLPFAIVYVVGIGEELFPGSNALSSFDLRGAQRLPGDIRPAEARLYDFLATVLSAQQKLYLLYNSHDLQKDQPLLPAIPLVQLQHFLNQNILKSEFGLVAMPMHADDVRYLDPAQQPSYQDVLVQSRDAERCLALLAAQRENRVELDAVQQAEWASKLAGFQQEFTIPPSPAETPTPSVNVTLSELKRYLHLPAHASLRRHLRVEEEDERTLEDEEPLVTTQQAAGALVRQSIQQLVLASARGDVQQALTDWQERFAATYADSRLRSLVPEEAFGEIDQAALLRDLQERIHGQGQIEAFLRDHAGSTFCGPVLLGESLTPLGPKLRFPALAFRPGHELPADAPQEIRLVGWTPFAWHSPGRFEVLIVTNSKDIDGKEISLSMIEPALLALALLANAEPNVEGIAAQKWLAQREFLLHASHRGGMQTWTYPAGSITPAEAVSYFLDLTRDFLDPAQFDLLPFDVLCNNKELQAAMHEDFATQIAPETYRTVLEEAIVEIRENAYSFIQIPLLVDMVRAQVPADALAKVQRRFRLLDRGPASVRRQPKISKAKRAAKP
jgi:exonuclease V gamma subunit